MPVKKIELNIPEDIFLALNEKPEELVTDMKIFAAVKFFEIGKLSLGKAADLAEMDTLAFIELLSRHSISAHNYAPEELEDDLDNIQKARNRP